MRVDRLMNYAWKYLVPLSIVNIMISAVWYEMVIRPGPLTFSNWGWGVVVTGIMVVAAVYLVFLVNRKLAAGAPLGSDWPTLGPLRTADPVGQAVR
jgi:NADH-quinone oxidoreductase subunit H